jgi:hypothetical protein
MNEIQPQSNSLIDCESSLNDRLLLDLACKSCVDADVLLLEYDSKVDWLLLRRDERTEEDPEGAPEIAENRPESTVPPPFRSPSAYPRIVDTSDLAVENSTANHTTSTMNMSHER